MRWPRISGKVSPIHSRPGAPEMFSKGAMSMVWAGAGGAWAGAGARKASTQSGAASRRRSLKIERLYRLSAEVAGQREASRAAAGKMASPVGARRPGEPGRGASIRYLRYTRLLASKAAISKA